MANNRVFTTSKKSKNRNNKKGKNRHVKHSEDLASIATTSNNAQTSTKPQTPKFKQVNIKKILKLSNRDQIEEVVNLYKEHVSDKKAVINLYKNAAPTLLKLRETFYERSVEDWQKQSGLNYKEFGFGAHPKIYDGKKSLSPETITQIVNELENNVNTEGKIIPYNPFFAEDDNHYEKLINCNKKVIGMTLNSFYSNALENTSVMIRLLEGEVDGKKHLFANVIRFHENNESISSGLSVLVNGQVKGIKNLLRIDTAGIIPTQIFDKVDSEMRISDNAVSVTVGNYDHINAYSKGLIDPVVPTIKAPQTQHIHKASNMQDTITSAGFYIAKRLRLLGRIRSPLVSMNAQYFDIYNQPGASKANIESAMIQDAKDLDGMIPFKRVMFQTNRVFNITNGALTKQLNDQIDSARHHLTQDMLPEMDILTITHLEDTLNQQNPNNPITFVKTQNPHRRPIPANLKMSDIHAYNMLMDKISYDSKNHDLQAQNEEQAKKDTIRHLKSKIIEINKSKRIPHIYVSDFMNEKHLRSLLVNAIAQLQEQDAKQQNSDLANDDEMQR